MPTRPQKAEKRTRGSANLCAVMAAPAAALPHPPLRLTSRPLQRATANRRRERRALTALPGVGRWTAEMLLTFSLQRPDVLAYDDLGIRKGICRLYGLDSLTKQQFAAYRARYAPHATVAALYLWHIAAE